MRRPQSKLERLNAISTCSIRLPLERCQRHRRSCCQAKPSRNMLVVIESSSAVAIRSASMAWTTPPVRA
jgi:hypothetical protein